MNERHKNSENFPLPHPNLADELNSRAIESEIEGGVYLKDIPPGAIVEVKTRSRTYTLEYKGGKQAMISGHPEYCPVPTEVLIHGSTMGGSGIKNGYIGRSLHLEYSIPGKPGQITTSAIEDVKIVSEPKPKT